MKRSKRKLIDGLPYLLLSISSVVSLTIMLASDYVVQWQHYVAFIFLILNGFLFYRNHKHGVLFLGLVIMLGIIGILAFQVGLVGASLYWTPFGFQIPIFAGNPILFGVLVLHLTLSGRYYVGMVTKRYWANLNNPEPVEF